MDKGKTEKVTVWKISKRTSLRPLTKTGIVDYYGKRELENIMARLKWVKIGDESSKELDQRTVDYSYGLHRARIDIQLKTSNESRSRRFRG